MPLVYIGFGALFVLALFAYLILRLKYPGSYIPIAGALVLLFTPTIVVNSSAWGQCDAIYAAFCLGSLYFLLRKRQAWACLFFGLAIAFKLQAIFCLPVLLMFVLKRALAPRYLLLIPAVFVLLLVPAYLAGRPASSLLSVYTQQVNSGGVGGGNWQLQGGQGTAGAALDNGGWQRPGNAAAGTGDSGSGGGQPPANGGNQSFRPGSGFRRGAGGFGGRGSFSSLTYNAPTVYQWLGGIGLGNNKWVGIGLAALAVALVGLLLVTSGTALTSNVILNVSLVCVLAIPFLLPEMHERYFYLAGVISVVYACAFPRRFYIPVVMQLASLLSYAPFLLHTTPVSLSYVAIGVLVITLIAAAQLARSAGKNVSLKSFFGLPPVG